MFIKLINLICLVSLPIPVVAASAPQVASTDEHRLSGVEIQRILDAAVARRETNLLPPPLDPVPDNDASAPRPIEGEIGFGIGTGGYREAFGTAVVPLGKSGTAIISFDSLDSSRGALRRR